MNLLVYVQINYRGFLLWIQYPLKIYLKLAHTGTFTITTHNSGCYLNKSAIIYLRKVNGFLARLPWSLREHIYGPFCKITYSFR